MPGGITPTIVGGISRRLIRSGFPTMSGSPLNFRCHRSYPMTITGAGGKPGFRIQERPSEHRLHAEHAKVVACDDHALERFTALFRDEKVERPAVAAMPRTSWPLSAIPSTAARASVEGRSDWPSVRTDWIRASCCGSLYGGGVSRTPSNQAEHRSRRADAERQRETARAVKPGCLPSIRRPKRRSCSIRPRCEARSSDTRYV